MSLYACIALHVEVSSLLPSCGSGTGLRLPGLHAGSITCCATSLANGIDLYQQYTKEEKKSVGSYGIYLSLIGPVQISTLYKSTLHWEFLH